MISISFFLLWNIPCAVGQNMQTILVGRFLSGLAGSAFLSVAAGTVSDLFVPAKVGPPMMLFTMSPFIGPPLGPLLGGLINEFTSW
jgi:predicted MFS family arabinose efflux permease